MWQNIYGWGIFCVWFGMQLDWLLSWLRASRIRCYNRKLLILARSELINRAVVPWVRKILHPWYIIHTCLLAVWIGPRANSLKIIRSFNQQKCWDQQRLLCVMPPVLVRCDKAALHRNAQKRTFIMSRITKTLHSIIFLFFCLYFNPHSLIHQNAFHCYKILIPFSWNLSSVHTKGTNFKPKLRKICGFWRDKCIIKVWDLTKICSWLKFLLGTSWHYFDKAVWSWYIFDGKVRDKKRISTTFLKTKFLACIFVYVHQKILPFLKRGY